MRPRLREHGRFVAESGLCTVQIPGDGPYKRVFIDADGRPVSHLTEWYRLRETDLALRTRQTYLDYLLVFMGFLRAQGRAWNDSPERVRASMSAFLQERLCCHVRPERDREGYLISVTGKTPLAQSSIRVLLAALHDFYNCMRDAELYPFDDPLRSPSLVRARRLHLRTIANAGAPDQAGIRGESWSDSARFATSFFRQHTAEPWRPDLYVETAGIQQRMQEALAYMIGHAPTVRDHLVLRLLHQTGARLHEIVGMTVGGYGGAGRGDQALVVNKGSRGAEVKVIYLTSSLSRDIERYVRGERAAHDPLGRTTLAALPARAPLFLTERQTAYSSAAFRYHWYALMARVQPLFSITFTPHDVRHLFVTLYLKRLKRAAGGDAVRYDELKEGFRVLMGWRSPHTIQVYDHSSQMGEVLAVLAEMQSDLENGGGAAPQPPSPAGIGVPPPLRDGPGEQSPLSVPGVEEAENLAFWEE